MTAPTRSTVTILAATQSTGGTKAAPAATGAWVDVRGLNGGDIAWSVKNSASAPGVQGQFALQVSDKNDGTNVADLWQGSGTSAASDEVTGLIDLPNSVSYVRMICYGNTTNAVTFAASLFAKA